MILAIINFCGFFCISQIQPSNMVDTQITKFSQTESAWSVILCLAVMLLRCFLCTCKQVKCECGKHICKAIFHRSKCARMLGLVMFCVECMPDSKVDSCRTCTEAFHLSSYLSKMCIFRPQSFKYLRYHVSLLLQILRNYWSNKFPKYQ